MRPDRRAVTTALTAFVILVHALVVTVARLPGRVAGGSTGPGVSFRDHWDRAAGWSGRVGEGGDVVPGGDDVIRPGPAGLDFQLPSAGAAGDSGGVQDLVAQVILSDLVDHGCDLRRCDVGSVADGVADVIVQQGL